MIQPTLANSQAIPITAMPPPRTKRRLAMATQSPSPTTAIEASSRVPRISTSAGQNSHQRRVCTAYIAVISSGMASAAV